MQLTKNCSHILFRFHDPKLKDLFNAESGVFLEESHSLPRLHMSLMRIWVTWLEKFPGDFRQPLLQVQLISLKCNTYYF